MRPIRARKRLPQVGQKWVGVLQLVLVALALRAALLLDLKGPMLLCCVGSFCGEVAPAGSVGSDSQDSVLMLKSFKETFRLSLKRFLCPPTVRLT